MTYRGRQTASTTAGRIIARPGLFLSTWTAFRRTSIVPTMVLHLTSTLISRYPLVTIGNLVGFLRSVPAQGF